MPASSDTPRRAGPLVPRRRQGAGPSPTAPGGHPPVLLVLPDLAEPAPVKTPAAPAPIAKTPVREQRAKTDIHLETPRIKLPARPTEPILSPPRTTPSATSASSPPTTPSQSAPRQPAFEPPAEEEDRHGGGNRRRRTSGKSNSGGVNWFSLLSVMFMGGIILFAAATWITGWRPWRKGSTEPVTAQPAAAPAKPQPKSEPANPEPRLASKPRQPRPEPQPEMQPEPKPMEPPPAAPESPLAAPASPTSPQAALPPADPTATAGSYPRTPSPSIVNPVRPSVSHEAAYPATRGFAPPLPAAALPAADDPAFGEYPRLEALRPGGAIR